MARNRPPRPLLVRLQGLFRQAPGGLTLEQVMAGLEPGPAPESQTRIRPKEARSRLEELIGWGMMHKRPSDEGYRYVPRAHFFGLFFEPEPAHGSEGVLWYSPDPEARDQLKAAREADRLTAASEQAPAMSVERDEAPTPRRRFPYQETKDLAQALIDAQKVDCPFCKNNGLHEVRSGDGKAVEGEPCSVSVHCQKCKKSFYAVVSTANGELLRTERLIECIVHPHFECSTPGNHRPSRALGYLGDHRWMRTTTQEALSLGWKRFYGVGKTRRIHWICADCLRPNAEHQKSRREERAKRTGRFIDGQLHCPGCNGTNVRIESGLVPSRKYIEKEIALYGSYSYNEVYGVCLRSWARAGDPEGCPLTHLDMMDELKIFYLPDGHRWRACACGKHVEIPEHQRSTQCECGYTLWLNYEDAWRASTGEMPNGRQ